MTSLDQTYAIRYAEEFITDDRKLAALAPDMASWRPEEGIALVHPGNVPVDVLTAARESSRSLSRGVQLEPVLNPAAALVAKALGVEVPIDPQGPLDQPESLVRVQVIAKNKRTFRKFWERVGVNLGFPDDANADEVGLAAVSGIEFGVMRAALTRVKERDARQKFEQYKPLLKI